MNFYQVVFAIPDATETETISKAVYICTEANHLNLKMINTILHRLDAQSEKISSDIKDYKYCLEAVEMIEDKNFLLANTAQRASTFTKVMLRQKDKPNLFHDVKGTIQIVRLKFNNV